MYHTHALQNPISKPIGIQIGAVASSQLAVKNGKLGTMFTRRI